MATTMIDLSQQHYAHALKLGRARDRASRKQGSVPGNGGPEQGSSAATFANVMGAAGEVAAALWLHLPLPCSVGTYHAPDLQIPVQVRTRPNNPKREKGDHLVIRRDDPPDHIYVLVYYHGRRCEIVGWIRGRDARREEWLFGYGDRPKAYFVPPAALKSPRAPFGDTQ